LIAVALQSARANPHPRSASLDDAGQARIEMTQRQIFDEIGGKASLAVRVSEGLAVLSSGLTLPEEAGDVSGRSFVSLLPQALSAVADFTYRPLKRKQLKLEVDARRVEDESHAKGSTRFKIDYPLRLEHVGPRTAAWLARTSYVVRGHGEWSRYTQASGKLRIEVHDPSLKAQPSDIVVLGIRVTVEAQTSLWLHWEVVPGSPLARFLSSREQLEQSIPVVLREAFHIVCQDVRVSPAVLKNNTVQVDIQLSLYNLRDTVSEWEAEMSRYMKVPGVRREDVQAALSTLFNIQFPHMEIVIRRGGDRFDVDADITASKVDEAIVGYLRLHEVLEPQLVRAGTRNEGVAELVRNVNAVQTKRFRNVVVAAADSHDGGKCDYSLTLGFPRGHFVTDVDFKYDNLLAAYAFADKQMGVPTVKQSYSLVKIHTTPKGLQGHCMYEAQGPWLDSLWALWAEASKENASLHALFPPGSHPALSEGRLALTLEKSRMDGHGWVKAKGLEAYIRPLLPGSGKLDPIGMDLTYDADRTPGKILASVYLKGASRATLAEILPQKLKIGEHQKIVVPAIAVPTVETPPALGSEIEADRKLLGVTPWTPPVEAAKPAPPNRTVLYLGVGAALLALAGFGVYAFRRRPAPSDPMAGTIVVDLSSIPGLPRASGWTARPEPEEGVLRVASPPPPPLLGSRFTVLAGSEAGRAVALPPQDLEMGRGEPTDLRSSRLNFAEPTISRVQAYLLYDARRATYSIKHEPKATNATLVNDRAVHSQALKSGDVVRMGRMTLVFEQGGEPFSKS
jgi:hypothetical protein